MEPRSSSPTLQRGGVRTQRSTVRVMTGRYIPHEVYYDFTPFRVYLLIIPRGVYTMDITYGL
jgi:hypothetical protein